MKQILYIFLFFSIAPLYAQKPNKTIHDSVFEVGDVILLESFYYSLQAPYLLPEQTQKLKQICDIINNNSNFHFTLQVHSDSRGRADRSTNITQRRAKECFLFMKPFLKDTTNLFYKGYGSVQPIISQVEINKVDSVKQEGLYAVNRRTVLVVTGKK